MIQRLAIFLGSRDGAEPRFGEEAYAVGTQLAEREIELVYGGGGGGLMGQVSQGVLDAGGRVYGVIPRFMVEREWGRLHEPGVQMHVVETMHQRKAMMAERADAFLTLPGGLGTLEELFEIWTWQTLSLHAKPVGLLNTDGFWDPLVTTLEQITDAGFMSRSTLDDLVVAPDLDGALAGLDAQTS
ncbi:TIGR00730 family Rossman fold protein [Nocardioides humilatus]|uniref:Cytokinin riboside 5'-monophosphate phosphoribohydrolase n=1 Tax=Nocardioides humilatus TaxID=2607660 RepID=A0A5B1L656_9ACTN|nr:TIGR00730 family Rossman fold protein [Nocardioides humilatus]KAA1415260.1 TIGR00730 family Rossman fold protein [Nocardioides humilatus]